MSNPLSNVLCGSVCIQNGDGNKSGSQEENKDAKIILL